MENLLPKTRDVVIVVGVTGTGKTNWVKQFVSPCSRLFAYDIISDFDVEYTSRNGLLELHEARPEKFRVGVFSPDDAELMAAIAFDLGNCTFVVEEVATLYNVGARVNGPMRDVILLGRHQRVSIVAIAQRMVNIPITIRSQASRVITFRQHELEDVKILGEKFGKTGAQEILTLPDFHCMDWEKGVTATYYVPQYVSPKAPGIEPDTEEHDEEQDTHECNAETH